MRRHPTGRLQLGLGRNEPRPSAARSPGCSPGLPGARPDGPALCANHAGGVPPELRRPQPPARSRSPRAPRTRSQEARRGSGKNRVSAIHGSPAGGRTGGDSTPEAARTRRRTKAFPRLCAEGDSARRGSSGDVGALPHRAAGARSPQHHRPARGPRGRGCSAAAGPRPEACTGALCCPETRLARRAAGAVSPAGKARDATTPQAQRQVTQGLGGARAHGPGPDTGSRPEAAPTPPPAAARDPCGHVHSRELGSKRTARPKVRRGGSRGARGAASRHEPHRTAAASATRLRAVRRLRGPGVSSGPALGRPPRERGAGTPQLPRTRRRLGAARPTAASGTSAPGYPARPRPRRPRQGAHAAPNMAAGRGLGGGVAWSR